MIIKKNWLDYDDGGQKVYCVGYFLFGVIPLYIIRKTVIKSDPK